MSILYTVDKNKRKKWPCKKMWLHVISKIPPQEGLVSFLSAACSSEEGPLSLVPPKDEDIKEMNHFPVFISDSRLRSPLLNLSFSNVWVIAQVSAFWIRMRTDFMMFSQVGGKWSFFQNQGSLPGWQEWAQYIRCTPNNQPSTKYSSSEATWYLTNKVTSWS
jgi:hypothetical protein